MFARTPRLFLRPGWPEDATALAHAIGHEAVVTKLSRAPWPYREADAREFLALPSKPHDVRLLVYAHDTAGEPQLVGGIGLEAQGDCAELGYWYTPGAWGRGYATEAGRAVVAMARHALPFTRLTAGWFVGNPASGHVLGKLGFRDAGRRMIPCLALGREVEAIRVELTLAAGDGAMPGGQLRPAGNRATAAAWPPPPSPLVAA